MALVSLLQAFCQKWACKMVISYKKCATKFKEDDHKSVNLQYNTLGCLDDGTNESSAKRLMFQVLYLFHDFLQNYLQKSFQFIFLFFFNEITKIELN